MIKKIYNLSFWIVIILGIPCLVVINSPVYKYSITGIIIIVFWVLSGFANLICETILKKEKNQ